MECKYPSVGAQKQFVELLKSHSPPGRLPGNCIITSGEDAPAFLIEGNRDVLERYVDAIPTYIETTPVLFRLREDFRPHERGELRRLIHD